ncbi:hypothetical protein SDRG_07436 [Saprolegnia diclina VS20]|uniref:Uncharacterized protein n=1 Tax=Saprolegnia diclina (strain VS20) TaxID=1156394 RepID=T0RXW0_SAPDV|nr:hypothetical protein SDRG_07436 [Saprolegnia diclina VS20]EQC35207.1 hypothetical protein SDRG_07436 [Saprolegnia diclina VS20]|eukprot:XP_008611491.1 hypothetical protein SDRG_07436 [Saprolegnia diclina VS20]
MRQLLGVDLFVGPVLSATSCVDAINASLSKWLVRFYNCALQTYRNALASHAIFKVYFSKCGDDEDFPKACEKTNNTLGDIFMVDVYRGLVIDEQLSDVLEAQWLSLEQLKPLDV